MSIQNQNRLKFATGVLLLSFIWLGLLPAVGQHWQIHEKYARLSAQGIDPSALFYSELECMDRIQAHFEQIQHDNPNAFWPNAFWKGQPAPQK